MPKNNISVTCKGAELIDINTLEHFQGELKTLTEAQAEKIKESMVKYGFSFPVFIWKSPKGNKIIDGHQRVFVLKKMLSEGFSLEGGKIPIAVIEAKNEKEAKEKVLIAASRYGRIDEGGLHDFLSEAEINIEDMMPSIDLPDVFIGAGGDVEVSDLDESAIEGNDDRYGRFIFVYKSEAEKEFLLKRLDIEGLQIIYTCEELQK